MCNGVMLVGPARSAGIRARPAQRPSVSLGSRWRAAHCPPLLGSVTIPWGLNNHSVQFSVYKEIKTTVERDTYVIGEDLDRLLASFPR